jgi:integrase
VGVRGTAGPLLATTSGGRMRPSQLWELVRRLSAAAEITEWDRLSAHSLRHTGITRVWAEPASWALALSRDSAITIGEIAPDDD